MTYTVFVDCGCENAQPETKEYRSRSGEHARAKAEMKRQKLHGRSCRPWSCVFRPPGVANELDSSGPDAERGLGRDG